MNVHISIKYTRTV